MFLAVVSIFLRFYHLENRGFYLPDEGVFAIQASSHAALPSILYHHFLDGVPLSELRERYLPFGYNQETNGRPAYIYLLMFTFFINNSDYSAFVLNAFLSIITIGCLYFMAKKMFGEKTAMISSLLLSLSPYYLNYSRANLAQLAASLFLLLGVYLYRTSEKKLWSGIIFGVSIGTHYLMIFPIGFFLAWHLFYGEKRIRRVLLGTLIPLATFEFLSLAKIFFTYKAGTYQYYDYFSEFLLYYKGGFDVINNVPWHLYLRLFMETDGVFVLILFICGVFLMWKQKQTRDIIIMTLASLFIFSLSKTKVSRTLVPFIPLMYLFAAYTLSKCRKEIIIMAVGVIAFTHIDGWIAIMNMTNPYKEAIPYIDCGINSSIIAYYSSAKREDCSGPGMIPYDFTYWETHSYQEGQLNFRSTWSRLKINLADRDRWANRFDPPDFPIISLFHGGLPPESFQNKLK